MKKVGLFVDTSNLFTVIKFRYGKKSKLSYPRYIDFLSTITDEFAVQIATCMEPAKTDRVELFYKALEDAGFQTIKQKLREYMNYKDGYIGKKVDCDVALAIAIIQNMQELDHVIIGSNDDDLLPVVEYVKEQGKKVTVFACMIPDTLRNAVDSFIEIPESLLESKDHETTKTTG